MIRDFTEGFTERQAAEIERQRREAKLRWVKIFVGCALGTFGIVAFFWLATVVNAVFGDFATFVYLTLGFSATIATCVVEIQKRLDH